MACAHESSILEVVKAASARYLFDYDRWLKGMRRLQSLYGKAD